MESSAQGAGAAGEQATREFPSVGAAGPGASSADARDATGGDAFAQRPEIFVGAAFVGGVVLAQLLKRAGR